MTIHVDKVCSLCCAFIDRVPTTIWDGKGVSNKNKGKAKQTGTQINRFQRTLECFLQAACFCCLLSALLHENDADGGVYPVDGCSKFSRFFCTTNTTVFSQRAKLWCMLYARWRHNFTTLKPFHHSLRRLWTVRLAWVLCTGALWVFACFVRGWNSQQTFACRTVLQSENSRKTFVWFLLPSQTASPSQVKLKSIDWAGK